jgi:carboxymethylenebutenolidase
MALTTEVTFPAAGGHRMRAALALPPGRAADDRHPGLLVIHEIFGLNDDVRGIAARLAAMGYAALAPDLYDRPGWKPICVARTLLALRSREGEAFDDLDAARVWLAARPEVDGSRIGAIGFCMGGGFALLYAVRAPVGAVATFYGDAPQKAEELRGVCPVLGSYGGLDRVFAPHAERLERHLTELGVEHDVKVYPAAGHSFVSRHEGVMATIGAFGPMKVGYSEECAEDAWRRVEAFFGRHLGAPVRTAA